MSLTTSTAIYNRECAGDVKPVTTPHRPQPRRATNADASARPTSPGEEMTRNPDAFEEVARDGAAARLDLARSRRDRRRRGGHDRSIAHGLDNRRQQRPSQAASSQVRRHAEAHDLPCRSPLSRGPSFLYSGRGERQPNDPSVDDRRGRPRAPALTAPLTRRRPAAGSASTARGRVSTDQLARHQTDGRRLCRSSGRRCRRRPKGRSSSSADHQPRSSASSATASGRRAAGRRAVCADRDSATLLLGIDRLPAFGSSRNVAGSGAWPYRAPRSPPLPPGHPVSVSGGVPMSSREPDQRPGHGTTR